MPAGLTITVNKEDLLKALITNRDVHRAAELAQEQLALAHQDNDALRAAQAVFNLETAEWITGVFCAVFKHDPDAQVLPSDIMDFYARLVGQDKVGIYLNRIMPLGTTWHTNRFSRRAGKRDRTAAIHEDNTIYGQPVGPSRHSQLNQDKLVRDMKDRIDGGHRAGAPVTEELVQALADHMIKDTSDQ